VEIKTAGAGALAIDTIEMTTQTMDGVARKHARTKGYTVAIEYGGQSDHIALTMLSDIFLASPSSIMVLSR